MGVSDLVGDARRLSPSAHEALRLRAVAALVAGRAREDVAAVFGVSLRAVGIVETTARGATDRRQLRDRQ